MDGRKVLTIILIVCGSLSLISLVITFLVYWFVPGFNNLHGRIVLSNIVSIFFVTIFFLMTLQYKTNFYAIICTIVGFFGYFSSLSMFTWMTIMCFDLSWTFSRSTIPRSSTDKFKFRLYSCVGWTIPLLFTFIIGIFQFYFSNDSRFNPNIGDEKCFIDDSSSLFLFYIPILGLMFINSIIFIIVVVSILIKSSETKAVRTSTRYMNFRTLSLS